MLKGLFLNTPKAQCSIYESGKMVFSCLKGSKYCQFDYIEIDQKNRTIPLGYDLYFFNYHHLSMGWLDTERLKKDLGFVITMVLEVAPNDPFVLCPKNDFDLYVVLDPTIGIVNDKVYAFPRPLEKVDFALPNSVNPIPIIGTFGFATAGKGFERVVDAVNKEFDRAIVRINIPHGDFLPNSKSYALNLSNLCKQKAKQGINVEVTHDYFDKKDLIKWCASNTLNCFLYDRNMPGLAATTDQAIVSGRPISVSNNDTFRHIRQYIKPYPEWSLKDSIEKSPAIIEQIKDDWSCNKFTDKFDIIISSLSFRRNVIQGKSSDIMLKKKSKAVAFVQKLSRRLFKYYVHVATLINAISGNNKWFKERAR